MPRLFLVVNEDRFFLSHRKAIALNAAKNGFDVTIVCKDTGQKSDVLALGLKMIELPINPTGENIFQELKTFRFLKKLYKKTHPDIVHHVGLKNILWGSLAAKFTKTNAVVNAVSGLGTIFNGDKPSFTAQMILRVLRFACRKKNVITIFQNHEDENLFLKYRITTKENIVFIKGSGVDLNEYQFSPEN